MENQS
jgi:hypothetical protein